MILIATLLTCEQALGIVNNMFNSPQLTPEQRREILYEVDDASGRQCNLTMREPLPSTTEI